MAKLYFRYGAVGSAKTLNLLAVAHNYKQQRKNVILMKPAFDNRFGEDFIRSRAGLEAEADVQLKDTTDLMELDYSEVDCILVDEAQFLNPKHIDQLREISNQMGIPVLCYGLRTDFKSNLFPGSKRLMELADSIEEVKSTCFYCNRKAVMNLKYVDGKPTRTGPVVELGAEEKYHPACFTCYSNLLEGSQSEKSAEELCGV